jgi:hypothetical protein
VVFGTIIGIIFIILGLCLTIYCLYKYFTIADPVPVDCSINYSDWGTCSQQPDKTWAQTRDANVIMPQNGGKECGKLVFDTIKPCSLPV